MRWYTCTPRRFLGNRSFFDRDSGLTSIGFRMLGVESMAIMLGPAMDDDLPEIIRAADGQLRDPAWWKSLQLDGVVFYGWGEGEYLGIAQAIAAAGIRLVQVSDSHGIFSALTGLADYLSSPWHHQWWESQPKKILRALFKIPHGFTVQLKKNREMVQLIEIGDFFLCAVPQGADKTRRLAEILSGPAATAKVRFLPIPIQSHFRFTEKDSKEDQVISVGRWDGPQKRQHLLMATIERAAKSRPSTRFRIFGTPTPELDSWHSALPADIAQRVLLEGQKPNSEVALAYRRSRVMLVTASFEGCHNSSAEAICSGCSIVGVDTPFLAALAWHASRDSGRLAENAEPDTVAATLVQELEVWDAGGRDPRAISAAWCDVFHPDRVAADILQLS